MRSACVIASAAMLPKREIAAAVVLFAHRGHSMMTGNPNDDEQVDLLGISRREKRLHGTVYALIILAWSVIALADALMGGCSAAQYPQTGCIIEVVKSISAAVLPALLATIGLVWLGRSIRAMFRRLMMVLPVIRDKYAENLKEAEARGVAIGEERGVTIGEERGIAIGEAKIKADAKAWYARKQRAEDNDEPFDEPPPWEE